ncbi:probable protein phosphatase 2C 34 [Papaver somniferum]|uniref:probable protein phosphatase 2C 34 n=1 Tax=Papaver somniferum TaxID=3469 RepID=UPI000E6F51F7|nr:probable protein phosphatase 2C 34 [Papaver somniferum]XP_026453878.1 probable protein phosphatase 2C 34 [Papaver somniferum]
MGKFSSLFGGLSCKNTKMPESFYIKIGKKCVNDVGKEVLRSMIKEAKKNELILNSSGVVDACGSKNFASVYSKRGMKAANQDCVLVWEEFGCQEDMMFCGVFDGHGTWGHYVSKHVRDSMPSSLLRNWQETLAAASDDPKFELTTDKNVRQFNIWKQGYLKTCAAVDRELKQHRTVDAFNSGTTAVTIVRQGDNIFISNVGDSRAVLATASDDGTLVPVQLTMDFKPNIPQEAERIMQCNGRVFCLDDEPGVHRVWLPAEEKPGLAMSRALGDFCVKDFGVISVPEVTQRSITSKDQFIILATDGVWDVISNQEAVQIVSSTPDKRKAAKRIVECAARAWKRKRRGIAADDISAICLFFHPYASTVSKV